MSFTEADVQNALKNLTDPNTKKDFVSSKSVKNIKMAASTYRWIFYSVIRPRAYGTKSKNW